MKKKDSAKNTITIQDTQANINEPTKPVIYTDYTNRKYSPVQVDSKKMSTDPISKRKVLWISLIINLVVVVLVLSITLP